MNAQFVFPLARPPPPIFRNQFQFNYCMENVLIFFLVGSMLLIFLVLCCSIMCLYVLSSVLWCPLRFPHENDVRFVFTSWRMSYYLCLLTYTGVQHILCFAFVFVFLRRVYSMEVKTNRTSFSCGNRNGHHKTELRT
jgi:hypothetical protein